MAINLDDVFKKMNAAPAYTSNSNSNTDERILKFAIGNNYQLRILPYLPDPSKTFQRIVSYTWWDDAKKMHRVISPASFGGRCPIMQYYMEFKQNNPKNLLDELNRKLQYRQYWLFNAYVVNDPVNPSNNGQVKVVKASKELWKVIDAAKNGQLDDKFNQIYSRLNRGLVSVGRMMIDLGDDGVNLEVKVTPNKIGKKRDGSDNIIPDYGTSEFQTISNPLQLSDREKMDIYNRAYNLAEIETVLSEAQIAQEFQTTFLHHREVPHAISNSDDVFGGDDDIDYGSVTPGASRVPGSSTVSKVDDMKRILEDADNDYDDDNEPF